MCELKRVVEDLPKGLETEVEEGMSGVCRQGDGKGKGIMCRIGAIWID
jgi:hypothetical protein